MNRTSSFVVAACCATPALAGNYPSVSHVVVYDYQSTMSAPVSIHAEFPEAAPTLNGEPLIAVQVRYGMDVYAAFEEVMPTSSFGFRIERDRHASSPGIFDTSWPHSTFISASNGWDPELEDLHLLIQGGGPLAGQYTGFTIDPADVIGIGTFNIDYTHEVHVTTSPSSTIAVTEYGASGSLSVEYIYLPTPSSVAPIAMGVVMASRRRRR